VHYILVSVFLFGLRGGGVDIKNGELRPPLTGLSLTHFCSCPKSGPYLSIGLYTGVVCINVVDFVANYYCLGFY
jgi:hypothetical protein